MNKTDLIKMVAEKANKLIEKRTINMIVFIFYPPIFIIQKLF